MRIKKNHWFIFLLFFIVFLYIYIFNYNYFSICSLCAKKKRINAIDIPFIWITILKLQSIEDTNLSNFLSEHYVIKDHLHNWLYVIGSGNGIRCAIGKGLQIERATRHSLVLSFIKGLVIYTQNTDIIQLWVKLLLHPDISPEILEFLEKYFSPELINNKDAFKNWYELNIPNLMKNIKNLIIIYEQKSKSQLQLDEIWMEQIEKEPRWK